MVEKKFFLESNTPIQEIGMRAQIVSFLIGCGVKEGNAVNDSENANKVIVAVRSEDEQKIEQIKKELVTHLNNLNENVLCYSRFPNDLMELDNPRRIAVMPLTEVSSGLMLEQTSKGAGALKLLVETFKPLEELPHAIKELTQKLK